MIDALPYSAADELTGVELQQLARVRAGFEAAKPHFAESAAKLQAAAKAEGLLGSPLGRITDLASAHTESTTCVILQESIAEIDAAVEALKFAPPTWVGPDLAASDALWRGYAARAHARELLDFYGTKVPRRVTARSGRKTIKMQPPRGSFCGIRMQKSGAEVTLYRRPDRDLGRVSGVCLCGGSMTCPVCAPRISARRAGEVREAATVAQVHGLCTTMETYTLTHEFGNDLFDEVTLWKDAFRLAFSGRHSAEARRGRLGFVNAAEVTYGRNGWHFHRHLLSFWKDQPDVSLLEDCWRSGARHVGRYTPAFEGHAFDSRPIAIGCEDYVAKIGYEIACPGTKASRTPLRLLLDDMEGVDGAGLKYLEALVALTRQKVASVRWSPRTRGKLGLVTEKSDEQLAQEEATSTDEILGTLSEMMWKRVVDSRIEYQLVAAAQDGEAIGEGQGQDAGQPEEVDLPAFLTADLPDSAASMMAAE